jgi:subtilisin family serine protease
MSPLGLQDAVVFRSYLYTAGSAWKRAVLLWGNELRNTWRALMMIALVGASSCSGSGGHVVTPAPSPSPTANPSLPQTSNATVNPGGSTTFATVFPGYGATLMLAAATTGSATITGTLTTTEPAGLATVSSAARLPAAIGGSPTTLVYIALHASANVTFTTGPVFAYTLPPSIAIPAGANLYLAEYNSTSATWNAVTGPATVNGSSVTFAALPGPVTFSSAQTYDFALVTSATPVTIVTPSPLPTATAVADAFACPTSATSAFARSDAASAARMSRRTQSTSADASHRRFATMVNTAYWPNDPYFNGFTAAQNTLAGNGSAAATYQQLPLAENASVPGQWDMHAIGVEHAFEYSQAANGSNDGAGGSKVNAGALGSSSVKIAVIDTGEDVTDSDLAGKVVAQHCFVTNLSGVQSSTAFTNDPDGHGTAVSGLAAANINNGIGFAGAGGNSSLLAYRVFPVPDTTCSTTQPNTTCSANTKDVAAAIEDAIARGANVISMSFAGGGCTAGVDNDATEQTAIADALAHNVIVIAAAGNQSGGAVAAPGCVNGVIAVGATSLNDGTATGTTAYSRNVAGASASSPIEYVPTYSQYGAVNTLRSASSWGIVAPGGDPSAADSSGTPDYLHWVQAPWTSTPASARIAGQCNNDYPNNGSVTQVDCRALVAGTSMATPHVAGAAALIVAANAAYQSPSAMKTLLCQTADDLGDTHQGCGRLNLYRAMAVAVGDTVLP